MFVEDSTKNVTKERQSLCCISVPALNPWVKQLLAIDKDKHSEHKPAQCKNKRTYPDESSSNSSSSEVPRSSIKTPETGVKRLCLNNQHTSSNIRCGTELNLPLPDSEAAACLVKVRKFQSVHRISCSELQFKITLFLYLPIFWLELSMCQVIQGLKLCLHA